MTWPNTNDFCSTCTLPSRPLATQSSPPPSNSSCFPLISSSICCSKNHSLFLAPVQPHITLLQNLIYSPGASRRYKTLLTSSPPPPSSCHKKSQISADSPSNLALPLQPANAALRISPQNPQTKPSKPHSTTVLQNASPYLRRLSPPSNPPSTLNSLISSPNGQVFPFPPRTRRTSL